MSYQPVIPLRLRSLFDAVCDDLATPEQLSELEAILRADEEARRLYLMYCRLHIDLHFAVRGQRLLDQIGDSLADGGTTKLPAGGQLAPISSPPDEPPVKSPVLGFLRGTVDYVNHSRRLMFLFVAVMLSGWFIFQVGSVLIGRWGAGDAPVAQQGPDHQGQPGGKHPAAGLADGTVAAHGNAVAWVSGSLGGRWQLVGANPASHDSTAANPPAGVYWENGRDLVAGQQVNLMAGLGEITFRSGAKLVISAPARFSVTSALGTDLQLGKLSARVPHDAIGFTVATPAGSVVDLGTEFGVEVTPDQKLDVQVFVGEVKVDSPSGGSGPSDGGEPGVHVTAGKTIHLEPGKPATLVESKDKDRFQRDLTIASDSGDKQLTAYLDFVRQLKPVVWLRMEGNEADKTIHDEMGNADARLVWNGSGNPFVKGAIGKGIWLRGQQLKDCAIIPDYPKAEHNKLSVTAWALADSCPTWAIIAANWGGQFQFGLHQNGRGIGEDLCIQITAADGSYKMLREGESHPFPLNEWQHVAFTMDGSTLRLYRQGREVATMEVAGLQFPSPLKALSIGAKTGASGEAADTSQPGFWSGVLDEVTVFNDVLTPEQIKKLATAPPR